MKDNNEILGCYVSTTTNAELDEAHRNIAFEKGRIFRTYLWGDRGICDILKSLKYPVYGKNLKLILFQFYVNPDPHLKKNLKEIEEYRKKEKSIGIPVIINDDNFFNISDIGRYKFLREIFISKLYILSEVIKVNNLDTNIRLLITDVEKIFK
ncbi:MAG: hypothetical protein M3004_02850 [Bacteroidota bacterium]|nr:hypothetical protein [Bacteroidota bacterium]